MKPIFLPTFAFCAFVAFAQNQTPQLLTNDVLINNAGMRLIITDEETPASLKAMAADKEVFADRPMYWMLHNTSSNQWQSVLYLGITNSFDFDMKTTNGFFVPKTANGKTLSVGPKSLTNINAGRAIRIREGMQDFPQLTELFNFPSNGVYILEVRYWSWDSAKRKFELTEPVRLRVIKQENRTSPLSINATNTSIPR